MKFECESQELYAALTNVSKALSPRPMVQILEGVCIHAEEDEITLMCSDGSLSIKSSIPAMIDIEGSIVLPGRLLTEIVRKLPQGRVSFSMNDKYAVTLRCQQSRSTVSGMLATEFPQMIDIMHTHAFHISQKVLRNMINKVGFAIAVQESRQALTGCLLELSSEELRLVGLDGYRLALLRHHDQFVMPKDQEMISAIIPGRVIGEMAHIMSDEDEMLTLHFDKTHIMVIIGNTTVVSSLLAGEYINYRQILPSAWLSRVVVKKKELQDAVERASLMAREGKNNIIRMQASENLLEITSMSELGDVHEQLDAMLEGESIHIAFNARYITDVVKNVDEEQCALKMNSSVSPCVITPLEGDQCLYLVLPVRVAN